jgi:hypothetical protein
VSARVRCARVRIGREGLVILILALAIAAASQLLVDLANLAMVSVTSGLGWGPQELTRSSISPRCSLMAAGSSPSVTSCLRTALAEL